MTQKSVVKLTLTQGHMWSGYFNIKFHYKYIRDFEQFYEYALNIVHSYGSHASRLNNIRRAQMIIISVMCHTPT